MSAVTIEPAAVDAIEHLSQGFPYFTHLLGKSVGKGAIYNGERNISFAAVFTALAWAKDEAKPGVKDAFYRAAVADRADATYQETHVACVLARLDHGGYSTASDVSPCLEDILKTPRRNFDFNAHLRRFSEEPPMISIGRTDPVRGDTASPIR